MRLSLLLLLAGVVSGCVAHDALSGPPINTYVEVPAGDPGEYRTSRSHGVLEIYLTQDDPTHTVWNGRRLEHDDPWGTITLVGVAEDGTVTIRFGEGLGVGGDTARLRASPGQAFPGTGIYVTASHPELGTALLRSRFSHTRAIVPRPSSDEARAVDVLPVFASVQPLPNGRVYLAADTSIHFDISSGMIVSIRGEGWGESGYADPGDTIHVAMADVVGAGAHWFVYLGQAEDGRLLFYEYTWFYDIMPHTDELVAVAPYGELPSDP